MNKTILTIAKVGGVSLVIGLAAYGTYCLVKKMNESDDVIDSGSSSGTFFNNESESTYEKDNMESENLYEKKSRVSSTISLRHQATAEMIKNMLEDDEDQANSNNGESIVDDDLKTEDDSKTEKVDFDEIDNSLDKLLDEE